MANLKEVARREALSRNAINEAYHNKTYRQCVKLFVDHHLEEIDSEYWEAQLGKAKPKDEAVLSLLVLESHWADEGGDGIDYFDFMLPGKVSDYLICVRFDDAGAIADISMES